MSQSLGNFRVVRVGLFRNRECVSRDAKSLKGESFSILTEGVRNRDNRRTKLHRENRPKPRYPSQGHLRDP